MLKILCSKDCVISFELHKSKELILIPYRPTWALEPFSSRMSFHWRHFTCPKCSLEYGDEHRMVGHEFKAQLCCPLAMRSCASCFIF